MRYLAALTAAGCLLGIPASALAADISSFPSPSGTYCSDNNSADCYTIKPTDRLRTTYTDVSSTQQWGYYHTDTRHYTIVKNGCWYVYSSLAVWRQYGSPSSSRICVFTGGQYMQYVYEQMRFDDIPQQDLNHFGPVKRMTITQMWSNGSFISQIVSVNISSRSNDPSAYCIYYTADNDNMQPIKGVALDRTPPSIMMACSFTEKLSEYRERIQREQAQQDNQNNDDNTDTGDVTIPADTTHCGRVSNGNELVTVKSSNNPCNAARTVLRSYSRTLRSPSGWRCNASMNDSKFRARCVKKTTARSRRAPAVYGIWIRH